MKKGIFILSILFTAVAFYQCSSTRKTETVKKEANPHEAELVVAKKRWPEATIATLANGQTIYETKCNRCHGLKKIENFSEADWEKYIGSMAPKAKLTSEEKETLRQYILSAREAREIK